MLIIEHFPGVLPVKNAEIGIEIEAEGTRLWPTNDGPARIGSWKVVTDGSLRGEQPAEYVLSKPIPRNSVRKVLKELVDFHKERGSTIDDSDRAGVHIHVNMQDVSVEKTINVILMYLLFEDVLVKYCGESREGNLFCLRARDAEQFLEALRHCKVTHSFTKLQNDLYRYASINCVSLSKYGTLEFRAFRTPQKLMDIEQWVNLVLAVKDSGILIQDPRDIVEAFSRNGEVGYMRDVFGKYSDLLDFPSTPILMREGVRRIQDIAYTKFQKKAHEKALIEDLGGRDIAFDPRFPGLRLTTAQVDTIIQLAKSANRERRGTEHGTQRIAGYTIVIPEQEGDRVIINDVQQVAPPPIQDGWVQTPDRRYVWKYNRTRGQRLVSTDPNNYPTGGAIPDEDWHRYVEPGLLMDGPLVRRHPVTNEIQRKAPAWVERLNPNTDGYEVVWALHPGQNDGYLGSNPRVHSGNGLNLLENELDQYTVRGFDSLPVPQRDVPPPPPRPAWNYEQFIADLINRPVRARVRPRPAVDVQGVRIDNVDDEPA